MSPLGVMMFNEEAKEGNELWTETNGTTVAILPRILCPPPFPWIRISAEVAFEGMIMTKLLAVAATVASALLCRFTNAEEFAKVAVPLMSCGLNEVVIAN